MEEAVHFPCGERELFGILHLPPGERGGAVLMVNGGPQARIGAHRSYVQVARYLCGLGYAVLRFDYAGLGDGQGDFVGYNKAAPSIRAALDYLSTRGSRQAFVWSLCDGAAATAVYARFDDRIAGMILCNPYVFSDQVRSQTYIKHYYLQRLMEREFWAKLLSFKFNPLHAAGSFAQLFSKAFLAGRRQAVPARTAVTAGAEGSFRKEDVKEEVLAGVCRFGKRVHFLLSVDDLTAMGFKDLLLGGGEASRLVKQGRLSYTEIRDADHTFSTPGSKQRVCELTGAALSDLVATIPKNDGRSS